MKKVRSKKSKGIVLLLTGGGDAPGLNPALVTLVRRLISKGYIVFAVLYGWEGLARPNPKLLRLDLETVEGLMRLAGTAIGTTRLYPFIPEDEKILKNLTEKDLKLREKLTRQVLKNLRQINPICLVAAGGDDTLGGAAYLSRNGFPNVIGIPKTMDFDLAGTSYEVGFWSYCEAVFNHLIPGFITTLKSHRRVGVIELFGRYSGFTVAVIGITNDACYIILPEPGFELNIDQLIKRVKEFYRRNNWALVVLGEFVDVEGTDKPKIGQDGQDLLSEKRVGEAYAKVIEQALNAKTNIFNRIEVKSFQASHPFRGFPSAYDAWMGARLGLKAAEMVINQEFGQMAAVMGDELGDHITTASIDAFKPRRVITPDSWWAEIVQLRNKGII